MLSALLPSWQSLVLEIGDGQQLVASQGSLQLPSQKQKNCELMKLLSRVNAAKIVSKNFKLTASNEKIQYIFVNILKLNH